MSWSSAVANGLWGASALPVWMRYRGWLRDPGRQQAARLARYVRDNRDTAFGRQHGFDRVDSVRAFQSRVPIRSYDELAPFVERIAAGEPNVLTREPVRRLAFTSGSTAGAKLVPYTRTLVQEFTRGAAVWMADLFRSEPALAGGPAYWSITPLGQRRPAIATRIPVGFDDDTDYLGAVSRRLAAAALAVPSEVRAIEDVDACRYVTLQYLLRATDLRLVSVWHPSFFTLLLDRLESWWPALLEDLARGTLTLPASTAAPGRASLPPAIVDPLRSRLRPDPRRAAALGRSGPRDLRAIWPALRLVSCWTDGPASLHVAELERRACGIRVQGKGLVATEAFVTVPFGGARPLALPCHFFELLAEDGRIVLPQDAETDAIYTIVVTTGGGFYRYRLQDRVRVTGWIGRTPSLAFLGKEDAISDLVGEKLSDGFVTAVVRQVCAAHRLAPRFALLAPDADDWQPSTSVADAAAGAADVADAADRRTAADAAASNVRSVRAAYTLFLDVDIDDGVTPPLDALAATLETALRENPHYAYAVDLGQLAPARVRRVDRGAQAAYLARRAADGLRVGDIKPAALSAQRGWAAVLPLRTPTCMRIHAP